MYYTSIALLLTAALFSLLVQTLAGGLSSTNIHPHRHNDNRKDFLAKECHKNGVVCLYETTRPYFAEAMSSDIQFDKGVPVNQRVITFRGRKDMAMGLVAILPGTMIKMDCGTGNYIQFHYQRNGQLTSVDAKGNARAEWGNGKYSSTGSLKVGPKDSKIVNFQCWDPATKH